MSNTNGKISQSFKIDLRRETTVGRYLSVHEEAFVNRYLNDMCTGLILDIACGSGHWTLPLHDAGLQAIGVDLDSNALNALQQKSKTVPVSLANAERLPFDDNIFDCILAIQCFEFITCSAYFQECSRVLRHNGLLIFDFLNRISYKWMLKQLTNRIDYLQNPSANLSYKEVFEAMTNYGFQVIGTRGYNWQPFTRDSDSPAVSIAATVEDIFQLERLYQISPKILVAARKTDLC